MLKAALEGNREVGLEAVTPQLLSWARSGDAAACCNSCSRCAPRSGEQGVSVAGKRRRPRAEAFPDGLRLIWESQGPSSQSLLGDPPIAVVVTRECGLLVVADVLRTIRRLGCSASRCRVTPEPRRCRSSASGASSAIRKMESDRPPSLWQVAVPRAGSTGTPRGCS